ncbi:MAG: chorismate mutase [Hyphomicrobiales bacterium]
MPDRFATLDAVRAKIDSIDKDLHRLMVERTRLARDVWKSKDRSMAGLAAIRPAREAQMLRAFAKGHRGKMPLPVLWRIWRELIIANIRAQSPVAVHVAEKADDRDSHEVWDLARAHFGFDTPMTRHRHGADAVRAASRDIALAVLPAETAAEWATDLAARKRFHIFDALPQITAPHAPDLLPKGPVVYLAGDVALEPCGTDTSVVLVQAGRDTALKEADRQGLRVKSCQVIGSTTLLGLDGLQASQMPADQLWGNIEVQALGAHADALIWEAEND